MGVECYDFDRHHLPGKTLSIRADYFMFSVPALFVLLFFGDVTTARQGITKVADAHRRVLTRVQQGQAKAEDYIWEMFMPTSVLPWVLLSLDDMATLREFMANSMIGKVLEDEKYRAALASVWNGGLLGQLKTEDGHYHSACETFLLLVRGIFVLLDENATAAALREWLPPPAELLRIAEHELAWRGFICGPGINPALLCARLHGERLGDWKATAEVAEGVLKIEEFNPLLRTEACRLLGRARHELGERKAACEAAEAARAEAAKARYVWLELMSLRDLLRWSDAADAEGVRSRLSSVAGRMAASAEELAGVLGEGVSSSVLDA